MKTCSLARADRQDGGSLRVVWRHQDGNVDQEFTRMTPGDVFELLESAFKHLEVVLAPSTHLFFMTKNGVESLTIETEDVATGDE